MSFPEQVAVEVVTALVRDYNQGAEAKVRCRMPGSIAEKDFGLDRPGVIILTDGNIQENGCVGGANYVIVWWRGLCVSVYFSPELEVDTVAAMIRAGPPSA